MKLCPAKKKVYSLKDNVQYNTKKKDEKFAYLLFQAYAYTHSSNGKATWIFLAQHWPCTVKNLFLRAQIIMCVCSLVVWHAYRAQPNYSYRKCVSHLLYVFVGMDVLPTLNFLNSYCTSIVCFIFFLYFC